MVCPISFSFVQFVMKLQERERERELLIGWAYVIHTERLKSAITYLFQKYNSKITFFYFGEWCSMYLVSKLLYIML